MKNQPSKVLDRINSYLAAQEQAKNAFNRSGKNTTVKVKNSGGAGDPDRFVNQHGTVSIPMRPAVTNLTGKHKTVLAPAADSLAARAVKIALNNLKKQ